MESVNISKEKLKTELKELLIKGEAYIAESSEHELGRKPAPDKWSKKEILGHLIDSAINNLQRFTEIKFEARPFIIRRYNHNELVKANNYQNADTNQILSFWLAINTWILNLIDWQTEKTLAYEIELSNGERSDLKFLMEDYVAHLAHHLNQIMDKNRN